MTHQNDASGAPRDRYTRVAIFLHWAIAVFIVFNLCIGFFMERFTPTALMLHSSSGLTVLVLTVARVVWRLLHHPPQYPEGTKRWERHTAQFAHFLLYAAMVLMPLSGWAVVSAHSPPGSRGAVAEWGIRPTVPPGAAPPLATSGRPLGPPPILKVWNLAPLPMIAAIEAIGEEPEGVAPQRRLHDEVVKWHHVGAFLLLGLLVLHVAGALKHQFIDRQSELARMGIGRRRQS